MNFMPQLRQGIWLGWTGLKNPMKNPVRRRFAAAIGSADCEFQRRRLPPLLLIDCRMHESASMGLDVSEMRHKAQINGVRG